MDYNDYLAEYAKIGHSGDRIFRNKGFVSEEDRIKLVEYIKTLPVGPYFQENIEDEEIKAILVDADKRILDKLKEHYGPFGISVDPNPILKSCIRKWGEEQNELIIHTDGETLEGQPALRGGFYRNNLSTVVYLTDDYDGGEIMFPEFDIKFRPEAGEAVQFVGRFKHGVTKVTDGERYTFMAFYRFDIPDDYQPAYDLEDQSEENFNVSN